MVRFRRYLQIYQKIKKQKGELFTKFIRSNEPEVSETLVYSNIVNLSNLDLQTTRAHVRGFFRNVGIHVRDILFDTRLNRNGVEKKLAAVFLTSMEERDRALQLNGTEMIVNGDNHGRVYITHQENDLSTICVTGFHENATYSQIEDIFRDFNFNIRAVFRPNRYRFAYLLLENTDEEFEQFVEGEGAFISAIGLVHLRKARLLPKYVPVPR